MNRRVFTRGSRSKNVSGTPKHAGLRVILLYPEPNPEQLPALYFTLTRTHEDAEKRPEQPAPRHVPTQRIHWWR